MANIPDGTYNVTVTQTPAASGTLVVSGGGTSATYQVTGTNTAAPANGFHASTAGVGWNCTVTLPGNTNSCTLNFVNGQYANGKITLGKVTGSCIVMLPEAVEDDWSATGPGSNVAATKSY